MDLEKIEFLPDDFEFVGDKQDITKDVVAPSLPAWKDSLNRFKKNKGAVNLYFSYRSICNFCTNVFIL